VGYTKENYGMGCTYNIREEKEERSNERCVIAWLGGMEELSICSIERQDADESRPYEVKRTSLLDAIEVRVKKCALG